jgi:hypothetical protein
MEWNVQEDDKQKANTPGDSVGDEKVKEQRMTLQRVVRRGRLLAPNV